MKLEIFKTGTHTSNSGITKEFTTDFLQKVTENYNNNKQNAPISLGHIQDDTAKAYGSISHLVLENNSLYAECNFNDDIIEMIKNKEYNNISAGFKDDRFTHLAVLGAIPPALSDIPSLSNYDFNIQQAEIFDFAIDTKKDNKIIIIDGMIDYELYDTIKKEIKGNDNITIQLFSPGGYASVGFALYNILKTVKNLTVKVFGNTASAATLIALSAKKENRFIADNVSFLIHQARFSILYEALTVNNSNDITNDLNLVNENLLNIYKYETNTDEALLQEMIYNEKSISADDAVKFGFFNKTFKVTGKELEFSIEIENKINTFITNLGGGEMPITDIKKIDIENKDTEIKTLLTQSIALNQENAENSKLNNETIISLKAEIEALTLSAKEQKNKDKLTQIDIDIQEISNNIDVSKIDNLKNLFIANYGTDNYNIILDIVKNIKKTVIKNEPQPTIKKIKDIVNINKRNLKNPAEFDKAQAELMNEGLTEIEAIEKLIFEMESK